MSERTEPNLNEMINSAGDGSGLQLPPAFVMVNPRQHRKNKKGNETVDGRTKGARSLFDRIQKRKMKEQVETPVSEAVSSETERAQKSISQMKKLGRQKELAKKRDEAKKKMQSKTKEMDVLMKARLSDFKKKASYQQKKLKKEEFEIHTYADGQSALNGMFRYPPALAVIDIKMPRMDGYELFRKIREKLKIPVIFLTSKDQEADKLKGLMQGVDGYVTKGGNFSKEILIETIKNTLNRVKIDSDSKNVNEIILHGDLRLDCLRHSCEWKEVQLDEDLTTTEFKIIRELVERPGIVKSRDRLMEIAYNDELDVDDRTIDSHIKRIRKKFRKIDPKFNAIHTLYGSGYQWK